MNRILKSKVAEKLSYYSMSPSELAAAMRIGLRTYYKRLNEPDSLTLGEFNRMSKKLKFCEEEQLKILKGQV